MQLKITCSQQGQVKKTYTSCSFTKISCDLSPTAWLRNQRVIIILTFLRSYSRIIWVAHVLGFILFQKSNHQWLHAVGDDLSDIIGQKNKTDIKNHLQPLVEHYPDFRWAFLTILQTWLANTTLKKVALKYQNFFVPSSDSKDVPSIDTDKDGWYILYICQIYSIDYQQINNVCS